MIDNRLNFDISYFYQLFTIIIFSMGVVTSQCKHLCYDAQNEFTTQLECSQYPINQIVSSMIPQKSQSNNEEQINKTEQNLNICEQKRSPYKKVQKNNCSVQSSDEIRKTFRQQPIQIPKENLQEKMDSKKCIIEKFSSCSISKKSKQQKKHRQGIDSTVTQQIITKTLYFSQKPARSHKKSMMTQAQNLRSTTSSRFIREYNLEERIVGIISQSSNQTGSLKQPHPEYSRQINQPNPEAVGVMQNKGRRLSRTQFQKQKQIKMTNTY